VCEEAIKIEENEQRDRDLKHLGFKVQTVQQFCMMSLLCVVISLSALTSLVYNQTGVHFINILRAAFKHTDSKSEIRH